MARDVGSPFAAMLKGLLCGRPLIIWGVMGSSVGEQMVSLFQAAERRDIHMRNLQIPLRSLRHACMMMLCDRHLGTCSGSEPAGEEGLFYANEVEAEIENFCPSVVRSRSLTSEPFSFELSHANCYILGIFE